MKTQEPNNGVLGDSSRARTMSVENGGSRNQRPGSGPGFTVGTPALGMSGDRDMDRWQFNGESPQTATVEEFNFNGNMPLPMNTGGNMNTWEMIGLGLEEPLPRQDTIDEL